MKRKDFICETDLQSECSLFKLITLVTSELEMAELERAGKHITAYKTMLNYAEADIEPIAFNHEKKIRKKAEDQQENKRTMCFLQVLSFTGRQSFSTSLVSRSTHKRLNYYRE